MAAPATAQRALLDRYCITCHNADVHGFDNNADILSVSPVLMERYLSAARTIS